MNDESGVGDYVYASNRYIVWIPLGFGGWFVRGPFIPFLDFLYDTNDRALWGWIEY